MNIVREFSFFRFYSLCHFHRYYFSIGKTNDSDDSNGQTENLIIRLIVFGTTSMHNNTAKHQMSTAKIIEKRAQIRVYL